MLQCPQNPLLHQAPMSHQTDFPHRGRGFEASDHLQLLGTEVLQRELRENRDAILHLDHLLQRLDTPSFVVEVVVLLHLGLELTEIHDL